MKIKQGLSFSGQLPVLRIIDEDKIPPIAESANLPVHFETSDPSADLCSYSILINGIPLYGQHGKSLPLKNKNKVEANLALSEGFNKIQLFCSNSSGIQSMKQTLYVNYLPRSSKVKRQVFFLGIGMDEFADSSQNLKYSTKDVRDLCFRFKERYKDSLIVDTLFNKNVSVKNVQALKNKLLKSQVNDIIILVYSGHGLLNQQLDYFLSTYNIDFSNPAKEGLPYDIFENLLDSIPARKKMLLIDACHSGEVDKETSRYITQKAAKMKLIGGKGADGVITISSGTHTGLYNSFQIMQELFVNIGQSTGASVIAAAGGTQLALEGVNNLPNGIFTYCILEAMKSFPSMTTVDFKKLIVKKVEEITEGLQRPTLRNESVGVNWRIW